jgi:hypothetical protein
MNRPHNTTQKIAKFIIKGSVEGKTKIRIFPTDNKRPRMQLIRRHENKSG